MLDIDSDLPDVVGQILLKSMVDVFYQGGPHPKILRDNDGRPSADLIAEAYSLLFKYLKLATVDGFAHEPPPPPDVFPNLDFPTMSDPAGDSAPGGGGGDDGNFWDDLWDFILSVLAVIAYIAEVAAYLATLPWAILADLTTYPLRLGLYYALELPLFHMLKNFRAVLVMTGYMLPMDDRNCFQSHPRWSHRQKRLPGVCRGNPATYSAVCFRKYRGSQDRTFRDPRCPHSHPDDEFRHPWDYPHSPNDDPPLPDEKPLTTAGPHPALVLLTHQVQSPEPGPMLPSRTNSDLPRARSSPMCAGLKVAAHRHPGRCRGFFRLPRVAGIAFRSATRWYTGAFG